MKSCEILISIIVPIYNAEDTLEKCVFSISMQSYKNLQIILIDDGSIDSSFEISKRLAFEDKRIEVYHTENGGSVAARKFGLKIAKGQYIGFVDADDYIESDMYQNLFRALVDANADFVHSGHFEEKGENVKICCDFSQVIFDVNDIESKRQFLKSYIMRSSKNNVIAPSLCTKLFKAKLIKKCFEDLNNAQQYGEDFLCLFRCILESRRIMLYRKAMYHYLVKEKSLSHMNSNDYLIKEIGMWQSTLKVLEEYQCLEIMKNDMCFFLNRKMMYIISCSNQIDTRIPQYYFKEINKVIGRNVVLFGAGNVGQDYYTQFSKYKKCNILAWTDSQWDKYHFNDMDVVGLEEVLVMPFDLIIIAIKDRKIAEEIRSLLVKSGIVKEKIIWDEPGEYF